MGLPLVFALPSEAKTNLKLPPHMALDALRIGQGDETAANTLAAAVNLGAVLSRRECQEAQDVMNAGLRAVASVLERGKSGKWGVTGDELRAIGEALSLSDDMQDQRTRAEMQAAIQTVFREAVA